MKMDKVCPRCGLAKDVSEFHVCRSKPDGLASNCKVCRQEICGRYRSENRERLREYNRQYRIDNREETLEYSRWYRKTPKGREVHRQSTAKYQKSNPEKAAAHTAVHRAIRRGELRREACAKCGSTNLLEAHHPDYSEQLNVVWLCMDCHKRLHNEGGDYSVTR